MQKGCFGGAVATSDGAASENWRKGARASVVSQYDGWMRSKERVVGVVEYKQKKAIKQLLMMGVKVGRNYFIF